VSPGSNPGSPATQTPAFPAFSALGQPGQNGTQGIRPPHENRHSRAMPINGAYTLSEVRAARVVIECERCNRRGDYSTARLIERFGADCSMPTVKGHLVDCPHTGHGAA